MPKGKKSDKSRKRLTEKDQLGLGAARSATKKVRVARETKKSRLDDIMSQIRKAQSTDSHQ